MTSPAPDDEPQGPPYDREVGLLEVGTLLAVLLVATTATWSLALAQLGAHDGWLAVGLGVVTAAILSVPALTRRRRPQVRVDRMELLLGAATVAAALVMFLPGDPYAYGDKDPGVYMSHAFAIAREGDVVIPDRVLERVADPELFHDAARYPGFWIEPEAPTSVTPQFFHLYPATAATAIDLVGPTGAWTLNPLLAALSTLAVVLAVRRAAGTLPAALTAALLVLSMPQVWQAKYTGTEILSQLLLAGAVFGTVVALRTRWVGGAAAAGVAIGTGFLARPDGILYVLLAVAVASALFALRWSDERVRWFVIGLAVTIPYAVWNAFGLREGYTLGTPSRSSACSSPRWWRWSWGPPSSVGCARPEPAAFVSRGVQRWAGPALVVLSAVVLLLAWYREDLFGIDYTYFGERKIRSYDDQNLVWLSWFFGIKGLGRDVGRHRRDPAAPLARRPPLAGRSGAHAPPRVPLRGQDLTAAHVVGAPVHPGDRPLDDRADRALPRPGRSTSGAGPSGSWESSSPRRSMVEWAQQSWPLRAHREFGGSYDFGKDLASTRAGTRRRGAPVRLAGGRTVRPQPEPAGPGLVHPRPHDGAAPLGAHHRRRLTYADAFPGEPIFVVTSSPRCPRAWTRRGSAGRTPIARCSRCGRNRCSSGPTRASRWTRTSSSGSSWADPPGQRKENQVDFRFHPTRIWSPVRLTVPFANTSRNPVTARPSTLEREVIDALCSTPRP